jgi:hypothetical protein
MGRYFILAESLRNELQLLIAWFQVRVLVEKPKYHH